MTGAVSTQVRAEAAAWLARLRSEARTEGDEAGFRRWLAESDAHREAFDAVNQAWEIAGGLRAERRRSATSPTIDPRRRALVGASLAAVAGVGALGTWRAAFAGVYSTGVGEQRRVALADGSLVILDTDSRIRVDFGREGRRVNLMRGRAHFQVARDPARPFVVAAADRRVVAVGTAFDVSREAREVSVVVIEGKVAVRPAEPEAAAKMLTAGRRAVFTEAAPAPVREDRPDLARVTAWQTGRAVFDHEPVASAVAQMNRYSRRPIVLADPAVGDMVISGVYRTGDTEAFARSLAALLPLEVDLQDGQVVLDARPEKTS